MRVRLGGLVFLLLSGVGGVFGVGVPLWGKKYVELVIDIV